MTADTQHVPTTDEVAIDYSYLGNGVGDAERAAERLAEFHRWLAQHDAETRADECRTVADLTEWGWAVGTSLRKRADEHERSDASS